MFMLKLTVLVGAMLAGCGDAPTDPSTDALVLDYEDFGPQVIAHELIGKQWWQWQRFGAPDPTTRYPIRVVVYRDLDLSSVRRRFPLDPPNRKDYRYVRYDDAVRYLERHIGDDVLPIVTARLKRTKRALQAAFGSPARE